MFCHDTYGAYRVEQLQTAVHTQSHDSEISRVLAADIETKLNLESHLYAEAVEHSDDTARQMLSELRDDFRTLLPDETVGYWYDLQAQSIFRVDDTSGMVTDEDMFKFAHLVEKADFKELEQFGGFKVFEPTHKDSVKLKANIVDGIWIRKWKVYGVEVKSRMCSRGCFDRQKHTIDRHSLTATRVSQRLVISTGMNGTMSGYNGYEYFDAPDDVDTESLDIQGAFLQGLDYQQLQLQARSLGYEVKEPWQVYVAPPENVWRHFRRMASAPNSWKVVNAERALWVLLALRATYGFGDAPLMFQLALICFLLLQTNA